MRPGDVLQCRASPADMAQTLEAVRRHDAAAIPVLGERGRQKLRDAARDLPFRPARPVVGSDAAAVRQNFEICGTPPWDEPFGDCARQLSDLINRGMAAMAAAPCPPVAFNEAVVQRYPPSPCGISPHRDHTRYINLIGVLVIDGDGDFAICSDRSGTDMHHIPAGPGDVLLMRAPGFDGKMHRPFHTLGTVHTNRLIVGYRQDTKGAAAQAG